MKPIFFHFLNSFLFCFLLLVFSTATLLAWNDDFAKAHFPNERKVCLFKSNDPEKGIRIRIHSIDEDESCSEGEEAYQFVLGKKPENSLAFLTLQNKTFFEKSSESSENQEKRFPSLLKFTCMGNQKITILENTISRLVFRGEIFFSTEKQICITAYENALKLCKEQLSGVEVLEKC